jgi:hypothetical protein
MEKCDDPLEKSALQDSSQIKLEVIIVPLVRKMYEPA